MKVGKAILKHKEKIILGIASIGIAGVLFTGGINAPLSNIFQNKNAEQHTIIDAQSPTGKLQKATNFYNNFEEEIISAMQEEFSIDGDKSKNQLQFEFLRNVTEEIKREVVMQHRQEEKATTEKQEVKKPFDRMEVAIDGYAEHMQELNEAVRQVIEYENVDIRRASGDIFNSNAQTINLENYEERFATSFLTKVNEKNVVYDQIKGKQAPENNRLTTQEIAGVAAATIGVAVLGAGAGGVIKDVKADKEIDKVERMERKLNSILSDDYERER